MLNENDKNSWINIKKSIEKMYKGRAGIYKIAVSKDSYLAGIANRVDKKVSSIISDLVSGKETDVSKILYTMSPADFNIEVFDETNDSLQLLQNSILDLGKPNTQVSTKEKEIYKPSEEPKYQYRANVNTVYAAYTKESLQWLLDNNGIKVNVNDL